MVKTLTKIFASITVGLLLASMSSGIALAKPAIEKYQ